jgi:hypothetical protein
LSFLTGAENKKEATPYCFGDGSCGNRRPVGTVGKRKSSFPTVPTGLGKLSAKDAPSFPLFPQLRRLDIEFFKNFQKEKLCPIYFSWGLWKTLRRKRCEFPTVPKAKLKTGHVYFGKNRTFLIWVDTSFLTN